MRLIARLQWDVEPEGTDIGDLYKFSAKCMMVLPVGGSEQVAVAHAVAECSGIPFWDLRNCSSIVRPGHGCQQSAAALKNYTPDAGRMRAILIEAREKMGLAQVELSRMLGMYDNFVWKYENGERAIKGPELVRIARVLNIDLAVAVREISGSYHPEQNEPARSRPAGTPLAQKLGILPNMRLFTINAPGHYQELLESVPKGARLVARLTKSTRFIHIFVTRRRQLDTLLKKHAGKLRDDACIWISWPKRSSQEYTDVTADVILDAALPLGLIEVDMCMVDGTWSAMKLVPGKKSD
ncbi:helix-turn-helix domain-containing protein [Steroidobacter cummioxidans]|uniref:helix-turn-helix domain-containing protein n=1 Tax=Steroidobacter cummioxidans TaxID=1803913 RepID=UPI000E31E7DD|nr:helix-turn-helix transcriptional regulator [Steroidobacter cummioxidans]